MVAYIYLLKIKGIRKQVTKHIYKIKNMNTYGKEIKSKKYCSKNLAQDIENWTMYHWLILLMIIKFSSTENQSKRRKERKRQSFIS